MVLGEGTLISIKKLVRKSFYQGVYVCAVVEEVHLGRATVRFTNGGARLTDLTVIGNLPEIGDRVVVDYAAGTPPAVRLLGGA